MKNEVTRPITFFLAEAAKEARVAAEAAWLMQGHRKVAGAARK
eukprot:COSAG02_NODE_44391_length_366_cov_1.509363_1_plen_42_part_10